MRIGVVGNGNIVKRFLKDTWEVEAVETMGGLREGAKPS